MDQLIKLLNEKNVIVKMFTLSIIDLDCFTTYRAVIIIAVSQRPDL